MAEIACHHCKRRIANNGTLKRLGVMLKHDGWIIENYYCCPKCKNTNANKHYWRKRDIDEATGCEQYDFRNAPAQWLGESRKRFG